MEMRRQNRMKSAAILFFVTLLASCASPRKSTDVGAPPSEGEVMGPHRSGEGTGSEAYGPFSSDVAEPVPSPEAVAPMVENPDRIVLVLGPGLSHGYSAVGVMKALHELKIPVHAIYATEVGALVGALYFTQPNPNRMDWALLRFTESNLKKRGGALSALKLKSAEEDLEERLREVFGQRRVEKYADRLHILLEDAKTGEKLEAKSGDLWKAVRGALSGSNGFSPVEFEGRHVKASSRKISDEYRIARQTEGYPIVVVLSGKPPSELFRKLIENQKSTLLYVPLNGIDNLDLKKRNQAVFSGKSTALRAANELLGLVGRRLE